MPPECLAVLHVADLYRDPRMLLPSKVDWSKIPRWLRGEWPRAVPQRLTAGPGGDYDAALDWLRASSGAGYVVIDTEYHRESRVMHTVGLLARRGDSISGLQLLQWPRLPPWVRIAASAMLRELTRSTPIVFQNTFADVPILRAECGIEYEDYARIDDTMLLHAVLFSEMPHDLEYLASLYGQYPKLKHLAAEDNALYNWGDCLATDDTWQALRQSAAGDPAAWSVYDTQSRGLIPIVLESNRKGIRVDPVRVRTASSAYHEKMSVARLIAQAYVGWPINVGSDDQLKLWLYDVEDMPVQTHKKTRKPTIDEDAVAVLRGLHEPLPDVDDETEHGITIAGTLQRVAAGAHPLLEARVLYAGALQAESHYIRPALVAVESGDGRIYPQTHIHAQASGRWSIVDPPMQQIPSDLRDIVMPDPGEAWIEWDWSNIETWLLAALAGDRAILDAKEHGWDLHTVNFCTIFSVPPPPDLRDPASCTEWAAALKWGGGDDIRRVFSKRYVYRLHYRGDPKRAGDIPGARTLGLDGKRLVQASQHYLANHPAIVQFWHATDWEVLEKRTTRTFMGRPRRLLGTGDATKREGTNHKMQGGVADILNCTLIAVKAALPDVRVVYTAHDAAKVGVPVDKVEEYLPTIRRIVEREWGIGGRQIAFPAKFKVRHTPEH